MIDEQRDMQVVAGEPDIMYNKHAQPKIMLTLKWHGNGSYISKSTNAIQ